MVHEAVCEAEGLFRIRQVLAHDAAEVAACADDDDAAEVAAAHDAESVAAAHDDAAAAVAVEACVFPEVEAEALC